MNALLLALALGATDPCAGHAQLVDDVRQATVTAIRRWPKSAGPFPFDAQQVVVDGPAPEGGVSVLLTGNPDCGVRDAEVVEPSAVCVADTEQGRLVRCSTEALHQLSQRSPTAPPSPALLYVLAHELGHLREGRRAAFAGPALLIRAGLTPRQSVQQARALCAGGEAESIASEEAADEFALEVLEKALQEAPYRRSGPSGQTSLFASLADLREAAHRFSAWEGEQTRDWIPLALRGPRKETDEANLREMARAVVCTVVAERTHPVVLPNVPGSHPAAAARMHMISGQLQDAATGLPVGRLALPPGQSDLLIQMENLIPAIGRVSTYFDAQEAEFYAHLWPYVCIQHLNPNRLPDCSGFKVPKPPVVP